MANIWMGWVKRESGSQGYACNGDKGRAYGAFQFDYRYGLVPFLKRAVQAGFSEFLPYSQKKAGDKTLIANPTLKKLFSQYAQNPEFCSLQDTVAKESYYDPAVKSLKKLGVDADKHSSAFRGSLFSMAIRSGESVGAKKMNQTGTEEEILRKAYATYGTSDANRWTMSGQLGDALQALKEESMSYDVNKLLETAKAEVGYLEKKSNASIDSKTANAGSGNFTKYWRDMSPSLQGQPWCDCFVDWCFYMTYGKTGAEYLECGGTYEFYTPTSAQKHKDKGQWHTSPKVGDQIFFKNSQRICHTGIVVGVTSSTVTTIEGNTSGASGLIANGGGVCQKSYKLGDSYIAGYGRPKYGTQATTPATTPTTKPATSNKNNRVEVGQKWLNDYYGDVLYRYLGEVLAEDGIYGAKTRNACVCVWKDLANRKYGAKLTPSNTNFLASCKTQAKKMVVKRDSGGTLPMIIQIILAGKGYYTGAMDTEFGVGTETAVKAFQKANKLEADGIVGADTWYALFN